MMAWWPSPPLPRPKSCALFQDAAHHRLARACGHAQVDEAGTGHVGRFDQAPGLRIGQQGGDQARGQFARIGLERLGQLHGDIAGDVAVAGVARTLQHDVRGQIGAGDDGRQGGLEQGNDLLFLLGEHGNGRKDNRQRGRAMIVPQANSGHYTGLLQTANHPRDSLRKLRLSLRSA
jgi:hypothetical protein